jgi:hypothetical protein
MARVGSRSSEQTGQSLPPAVDPQPPFGHDNAAPATNLLAPEASQTLSFVNHNFIADSGTLNNGSIYAICTRKEVLSVTEGKLFMAQDFEENLQGSVKNSQETQTASIEAATPKQFTSDTSVSAPFLERTPKRSGAI